MKKYQKPTVAITAFSCDGVSVMLLSGNYNQSTAYIDLRTNGKDLINIVKRGTTGTWNS